MPSRIIHFRLDDETLLSCLEFYQDLTNGESAPLSTRIAGVLSTLMKQLRDDGYVQTYQPNEVGIRLNAFLSKSTSGRPINLSRPKQLYQPSLEEESNPPSDSDSSSEIEHAREFFEQLVEESNPRARLRELISRSVQEITEPRIDISKEVWGPDPEELPDPEDFKLNLSDQPRLSLEELSQVISAYPKQTIAIQEALVSDDLPTILAHSIVLELANEDSWFTDHYFQTVGKVLKHVKETNHG